MRLVTGKRSDVGRVRDGNEDAYVIDEAIGLVAVADGMGGHQAGEVASATALDALRAAVRGGEGIRDAIAAANSAVIAKSTADDDLRGMGTTVTAGTVVGTDTLLLGHVGDSRAYLVRDRELSQVTEDHSLVEELVREGQLTPEQAQVHPRRSVITRALGIDPAVEIDVYPLELRVGDRVMLCSDGLTTMVRFDNIAAILRGQPNPQLAADELVDAANLAGGEDNITVIVIDVEAGGNDDDAATLVGSPVVAGAVAAAAARDAAPETKAETKPGAEPEPDTETGGDEDPPAETVDAEVTGVADEAGDTEDEAEADDVVGATIVDDAPPKVTRRQARALRREERRAATAAAAAARAEEEAVAEPELVDAEPRRRGGVRTTFRIIGWVLPVLIVVALAIGAVGWYARRYYFVGADGPTLVIYKGVPGGMLGWDPTVEETTDVDVDELSEAEIDDIGDGKKFSSIEKAEDYVARLDELTQDRREAAERMGPTTTTTAAPTP